MMAYIAADAKQFRGPMSRKMYEELVKIQAEFETGSMGGSRSVSLVVAANDSSTLSKAQADYVCSGSNDDIIINESLYNSTNGKTLLVDGTYNICGGIIVPNNTTMTGMGIGTKIYKTASVSSETLAESIDNSITSFNVSDGSKFTKGQTIKIDNEDFYITDINTNTLAVVTRPHNTSTAASHTVGASIHFNMEAIRNELEMEGTAANVSIQNVWLDAGRNVISDLISNGITIRNCDNSTVNNCYIQNSKGIYPDGPNMDNMRGTGIALDKSNYCYIYNNCITKTEHGGISIRNDSKYSTIENNTVYECDWEGIVVCNKTGGPSSSTGEGCSDINICNNSVWDCGYVFGSYGIFIEDQASLGIGNPHIRINIVSNTISKIVSGMMGAITIVRQSGTTKASLYCNITNNLIKGVDYDNISINRADHCIINNNVTNDCVLSNIYVSNSDFTVITNNSTNHGGNHGVGISNSDYCLVNNNMISKNGASQIACWGSCSDNQIANNVISCATDKKGVELGASNSLRNQISNNKILCVGESYAGHGIYVVDGANYTLINGNYIVNENTTGTTPKRGIEMMGSYSNINNNTFRSIDQAHAFGYGIRLRSTAEHNTVLNNDLRDTFVNFAIEDQGSLNDIYYNIGYNTESSGIVTLANGQTSVVVNHSLSVTPNAGDIMVTPIESWGNMTQYFIDTYTAGQFTIHANVDPGQDVDFAWKAIVL